MDATKPFFLDMPSIGGHSLAMDVRQVDVGDGMLEMQMPWRDDFLMAVRGSQVSTGPILTVIDSAAGAVVYSRGIRSATVTLDMRVDYLRAQRAGTPLTARAWCDEIRGRLAHVRCTVHDGDLNDPVATSVLSFFVIDNLAKPEGWG